MQVTSFRLISALITLLLLLGLSGVVVVVMRTTSRSVSVHQERLTPTPFSLQNENISTVGPQTTLPADQQNQHHVVAGGFTFVALPEYDLDLTATAATLTSQSGAIFLLRGGPPEQLTSSLATAPSDDLDELFDAFVAFYASRDQFQSRNKRAIAINDARGHGIDLVSQSSADGFAGRIVMVQPAPTQLFLLVGVSPVTAWESTVRAEFEALVSSIRFLPLAAEQSATAALLLPTSAPTRSVSAILHPTPAPTSPTATVLRRVTTAVATPAVRPAQVGWRVYSNANEVNDLLVVDTTIWAATNGGVGGWNRSNNTFVKYTILDGLTANRTTAVVDCPLPGFGLVFGSAQGLQIFEQERGLWKTLNSTNSEMHFDDVVDLYCSPENGFFIVAYAQHGLDIFDVKTGWTLLDQRRGLQQNTVNAFTVIGDREALWVSSGSAISVLTENGVILYDKRNTPLDDNPVTVIVSDAQGLVWLGAGDKVYRIDGDEWTIYSDTYVLASPFPTGEITTLKATGDGTLWIGSAKGELCLFDPTVVTCKAFFDAAVLDSKSGVTSVALDALGRVYVATARDGVRMYDGKGWRSYHSSDELPAANQVRAFAQNITGFLWIATDAGLYQIDPANDRIVQHFTNENTTYPVEEIVTLYATAAGGLWVGGKGAGYYDGVQWKIFTSADGLASDRVLTIAVDGQKRVWFGTDQGLSIWNGESFFTLTRADRLPSDTILTLLTDDNTMWIGSDAGLLHFVGNQFQIYTTATSALAGNRITALTKAANGDLLVGTDQGVSRWAANEMSIVAETRGYPASAIALSAEGDLWLGTSDQGIRYFDGTTWSAQPDTLSPPDPHIRAIAIDAQGTVWMAGVEGGILRYVP